MTFKVANFVLQHILETDIPWLELFRDMPTEVSDRILFILTDATYNPYLSIHGILVYFSQFEFISLTTETVNESYSIVY